ncbi:uncharacterized protein [Phaenicophaeus curvirostris]|uniref:uncharacterized protein n=1 Tax=Phaenicophaeus curvirostris TaxID=33595 RepID=UPI0037F09885
MGTAEFSAFSKTGIYEELYKSSPGGTTAEDRRETSACEDKTAVLEALCHDLQERVTRLEEGEDKRRVWAESVDTQLQELKDSQRQYAGTSLNAATNHYAGPSHYNNNPYPHYQGGDWHHQGAFPGYVVQKELQEKEEENKKLKERVKDLEARNEELLSKVMSMHKHSEDMNDPSRLSAVLQMYEKFRLHEWEKFRTTSSLTYKKGSIIIKRLFDACEEDIQQRKLNLFEVLGIPPCNETMTNSNQGIMQEIRNILRYSYYQNQSEFYHKIVMQASIDPKTTIQKEFTMQCCRIYCLLLLQDSPLKAVWNLQELKYLEHVDKKGYEYWRKPTLLWPIIKCGEQVVVKGVVWDEK